MKVLTTIIITLLVLIGGALGFVYSGAYSVAATDQDSGLVNWFLATTRERSIDTRIKNISVPELTNAMAQQGHTLYRDNCVGCHGAPGKDPSAIGEGLNPEPPYLADGNADLKPAEAFWILQHGIKMTGMPAFGKTRKDDELWNLVAFVQKLPGMTPQVYQAMAQNADSGSSKDEQQTAASEPSSTPASIQ